MWPRPAGFPIAAPTRLNTTRRWLRVQAADSLSAEAPTISTIFSFPKRVGFVIGILFLEINGYSFVASEEQAAQVVINLASGKFDELGYAQFLEQNVVRRK